jgi:hypothetical protein
MVLSHDGFKTVAVFRRQIDGDSSAAGHGEQVKAEESETVPHHAALT